MAEMDGLLLTGGPDVAAEFLHQDVPDPSVLDTDTDAARDRWEFQATKEALARELPIFAICKGLQLFNVALGGTLHLDIPGHNAPEQENHDVQRLRNDRAATHRFEKVNSSHHQAIDRLGEGLEVEAWSARRRHHRAGAVEELPVRTRGAISSRSGRRDVYAPLFADFVSRMNGARIRRTMASPQNTIAIVYDYDQTLSPSYMQDEVIFPPFGINGGFWRQVPRAGAGGRLRRRTRLSEGDARLPRAWIGRRMRN